VSKEPTPETTATTPVLIPQQRVSAELLQAVVEEFITREGTDYGEQEFSLAEKVQQVRQQLERGLAFIVFDPTSQTCSLVNRQGLEKLGLGEAGKR
jgi:uncharacterized protein YheU (UPF0270 family)